MAVKMHNRAPGKQFVRTYSILMVLWIGFIFWNSLHSGAESAQSSNFVLEWLRKIPFLTGLDGTLVRKGAHFTEFAMLGALAAGSVPAATFAKPLFCALLTAVSDETIQLFVEGRSSVVRDVWIDFAGALLGVLLYRLIFRREPEQRNPRIGRRFFLPLLLAGCCMAFIWGQSLQDAQTSNEVSGTVMHVVQNWTAANAGKTLPVTQHLIRKSAHFTEFFALGVCLYLLFPRRIPGGFWMRLFLGLLLPCSDEALQLMVNGRSSRVPDVWIDFSGAVCGMLLAAAGLWLWARRKRNENLETDPSDPGGHTADRYGNRGCMAEEYTRSAEIRCHDGSGENPDGNSGK